MAQTTDGFVIRSFASFWSSIPDCHQCSPGWSSNHQLDQVLWTDLAWRLRQISLEPRKIGPRTNNHFKGFHSGLNKAVGNPHPQSVSIVEEFQKLANKADRDASRIDNGNKSNVYRRKCDKAKDEDISLTIQKLLDGVMDLSQFLNYSIKFIANDKK